MPIVGVSPFPPVSREATTVQLPAIRPTCPPWCTHCWSSPGDDPSHTRPIGTVTAGVDLDHTDRPAQVVVEQYGAEPAAVYVQLGVDDGAYMSPEAAAVLAAHLLAAAHTLRGAR